MIADRYGVVNDAERVKFEKKYHLPFGYELVTFNYRKAEDYCKKRGKGYVVDRIFFNTHEAENKREIIYKV